MVIIYQIMTHSKKNIDLIDTLKVALLSRGTLAKRALVRIRVEINERKVLERES